MHDAVTLCEVEDAERVLKKDAVVAVAAGAHAVAVDMRTHSK